MNNVVAPMTALTQQLASAVVEADSVLFLLYSRGDMQSSDAASGSRLRHWRQPLIMRPKRPRRGCQRSTIDLTARRR